MSGGEIDAEREAPRGRKAAVLFDMDGLMLDTERPAVRFWLQAAAEHGWTIDEAVPASTIGLNEADTRRRILEACGNGFPYDAVRNRLETLFVEDAERNGIPHRPGLVALLDRLDAVGVPYAVATSTPRKAAIWKLERSGLEDRFPLMACGDEVVRGKPAPDIFLLAARLLGAEAEDCIGFEDSAAGLAGLAAAGIRSVFVKDLIDPPPEILGTVWRRMESLADAAGLFDR